MTYSQFKDKLYEIIVTTIKGLFVAALGIAVIACIGQGIYLMSHANSAIHEIEAYLSFILAVLICILLKLD